MSQQIMFFNKNKFDISNTNVVITASEAQAYVDLVRNRSNTSAWVTTGSTDAALTNVVFDFSETRTISNIFLLLHNFKSYTIQYWNGSSYVDFSTPINETTNTNENKRHSFDQVETTKVKLIVNGTMTPDEDKYLFQFIATTLIGQLSAYPVISNAEQDRNRVLNQMLSGKRSVIENIGGFAFNMEVPYWNIVADIAIIESLYEASEGFLVWLCGGDESQFFTEVQGYRLEDLYLMKCLNEYSPDFVKGIYINGLSLNIKLGEVVD